MLLGTDPVRDHPDPALASQALEAAEFVVAFDAFITDSSRHADVILPVATYSEVEGTATNLEGRVQKVNALMPPAGQARPVWSTLDDLAVAMGGELVATSAESVSKEISEVAPAYRGVTWDLLAWGPGREGAVVPLPQGSQPLEHIPVDPGVRVISSRMTLHTSRVLYDDGVLVRKSPALAALAPAPRAHLHPRDAALLAVSEGDLVAIEAIGTVQLPVVLDSTLAPRTVYVPFNLAGTAGLGASAAVTVDVIRGDQE
jgi:predicted molibdopterin-dependent oxidoreductase YjgC